MVSKNAGALFDSWTLRGGHERPVSTTRNVGTAYAMWSTTKKRMIFCRVNGVDYHDEDEPTIVGPLSAAISPSAPKESASYSAMKAFFPPTFIRCFKELGLKLHRQNGEAQEQVSLKHGGRRYVLSAWQRFTPAHGMVMLFTSISLHYVKKTSMPSEWAVSEFDRWFAEQKQLPSPPPNKLFLKSAADGTNPWRPAKNLLGIVLRDLYDDAMKTDKRVVHHRHENTMLTLMVLPGFVGFQRTALGGY